MGYACENGRLSATVRSSEEVEAVIEKNVQLRKLPEPF